MSGLRYTSGPAVASGNGVLLKGGKEAARTNAVLHRALCAAVSRSSGGRVGAGAIGLVEGRAQSSEGDERQRLLGFVQMASRKRQDRLARGEAVFRAGGRKTWLRIDRVKGLRGVFLNLEASGGLF